MIEFNGLKYGVHKIRMCSSANITSLATVNCFRRHSHVIVTKGRNDVTLEGDDCWRLSTIVEF